jgi:chromosome segregation ATPase
MVSLRGARSWTLAGLFLMGTGCASQWQYDAIARANLQLQDKLAASQADRVKARTQVALLRQELVQAKQAQQEANDRLRAATVELGTLRVRLDMQARRPVPAASASEPAATQPAP